MLIQSMKKFNIIDHEMQMFNLQNSDYTKDDKFKNGVIFGKKDIQEQMGDDQANLRYVNVQDLATTADPNPKPY